MAEKAKEHRKAAAAAAQSYLGGRLSWQEFMDAFGDSDDERVADVVDLIEHEPKRGGIFGVSDKEWALYCDQLRAAIAALAP